MQHSDQDIARYRKVVLVLLFSVSALHYLDRNIVSVLIVPIAADLRLSDTQIGLITGLAFGVIYAACAVPIARIADISSRTRVLTISLALWSAMTVLCGFASNWMTLFLCRIGVGAGESGGQPTMQAIAAETFPPEQRARALSVTAFGGNVGMFLGLALGGLVAQVLGWRSALQIAGTAGLVLAVILWCTLKPHPPGGKIAGGGILPPALGMSAALGLLLRKPAFLLLLLAGAFATTGLYAVQVWSPTFLVRTFALSVAESGIAFAVFHIIAAGAGTLVGGVLGDRLHKVSRLGQMWVLMVAFGGSVPFLAAMYLAPSLSICLAAAVLSGFVLHLYAGPLFATIQDLADPMTRATAPALFMMVISLTGSVLGPLVVGVASDRLAPRYGEDALRYALCGSLVSFVIATVLLYCMTRLLSNPSAAQARGDLISRSGPTASAEG